jgi:HAD superfamily hydrolase (TIGR01549 family)
MKKAVIFDVDGVLLDDIDLYVKAYMETSRMLKLKAPEESEIKAAFGLTREEMLKKLFVNVDDNMRKVHDQNIKRFTNSVPTMDGLEIFLESLKTKKAIVSSKPRADVERQLRGFTRFFDVIITKEQTQKHKPDPEPIFLACKELDVSPEESVYVGDAINDWKAAKGAGIEFIGFTRGAATVGEFEELKARHVNSLKDLLVELA